MKPFVKKFIVRGLMFAWVGPFILAIVWMILKAAGVIDHLTVNEVVLGILTMTVMAFIAAGITIVYQMEALPKSFAGLIHMSVLYIDYLGFYLLNGWISTESIWMFTLIFAAGFAAIWMSIYIPTKVRVNRLNRKLNP